MIETFLRYLSSEKRCSSHTFTSYRNDLNQFNQFLYSTFQIESLHAKQSHIRDWIMHLSYDGISASSINRKITTLKSYYKFLVGREYLDKNPATSIKSLKTDKSLPSFLKEGEVEDLLDRTDFEDNFSGKRDRLLLELFYGTGIRLSELCGLKEEDINLQKQTIKVLGKRNKERIIPIHMELKTLLVNYIEEKKIEGIYCAELMVTDSFKPIYPVFVYRKIKKYLSAVTTLSKKSPHVMRHTFATHLLNKGADLNAIKDLLGHTSLAATQVYTHNSIEKLKATFEKAHPKA